MAEKIRFRLTAARVGVSLAMMALIAGIAEKVQSRPNSVHATDSAQFLKLTGISGNTRTAFLKLEQKLVKLDTAFSKLQKTFLKIGDANAQFLKITDANQQFLKLTDATGFLKITDANSTFLKIGDANSQFLKIGDANAQFLKIGGTAADSGKLGGMTPDAFLQGHGNVLTGEVSSLGAGQGNTVLMADGSVKILIGLAPAGGPQVTLENDTGSSLYFTAVGGTSQVNTIPPGGGQATITPNAQQTDIQIFGAPGTGTKVWTATVSNVSILDTAAFVGQMIVGSL